MGLLRSPVGRAKKPTCAHDVVRGMIRATLDGAHVLAADRTLSVAAREALADAVRRALPCSLLSRRYYRPVSEATLWASHAGGGGGGEEEAEGGDGGQRAQQPNGRSSPTGGGDETAGPQWEPFDVFFLGFAHCTRAQRLDPALVPLATREGVLIAWAHHTVGPVRAMRDLVAELDAEHDLEAATAEAEALERRRRRRRQQRRLSAESADDENKYEKKEKDDDGDGDDGAPPLTVAERRWRLLRERGRQRLVDVLYDDRGIYVAYPSLRLRVVSLADRRRVRFSHLRPGDPGAAALGPPDHLGRRQPLPHSQQQQQQQQFGRRAAAAVRGGGGDGGADDAAIFASDDDDDELDRDLADDGKNEGEDEGAAFGNGPSRGAGGGGGGGGGDDDEEPRSPPSVATSASSQPALPPPPPLPLPPLPPLPSSVTFQLRLARARAFFFFSTDGAAVSVAGVSLLSCRRTLSCRAFLLFLPSSPRPDAHPGRSVSAARASRRRRRRQRQRRRALGPPLPSARGRRRAHRRPRAAHALLGGPLHRPAKQPCGWRRRRRGCRAASRGPNGARGRRRLRPRSPGRGRRLAACARRPRRSRRHPRHPPAPRAPRPPPPRRHCRRGVTRATASTILLGLFVLLLLALVDHRRRYRHGRGRRYRGRSRRPRRQCPTRGGRRRLYPRRRPRPPRLRRPARRRRPC